MATTPAQCTGFEIPDITAYGTTTGTAPTLSTAHPRTGAYALKCAATAGKSSVHIAGSNNNFGWTTTNRTCLRFAIYIETMPAGTTLVCTDTNFTIDITSAGILRAQVGSGTVQNGDSHATLVTGQYYVIELEIDLSTASNWKLNWRVDNNVQTQATYTGSATTPTILALNFGNASGGTNQTFAFHYDDLLISSTAGDYPLGNGEVRAYAVSGKGTHNITTGAFQDDGANAILAADAGNSYTKLTETTPDSTSWVRQTTGNAGNTDYLEYAFADTGSPSLTPQFVRCAVFTSTAAGGATNGSDKLHDSTDTTINTTASTTFNYREARLQTRAGGAGAWTTAAIDALTIRVGFSGVTVTNTVRLSFAILEVDYQRVYNITSNNSEAGTITPAGALTKETDKSEAGTVTPAGALKNESDRLYAGTVTPAGALKDAPTRVVGGTVTPHGAVAVSGQPHEAGTVTPAGVLHKETDLTETDLHGTVTPAGTLSRDSENSEAGTVTPAGALTKNPQHVQSGSTTPAGSLAVTGQPHEAGTVTPAGALHKEVDQTATTLQGTITPSGVLSRESDASASGTATPAGALTITITKALSGTITPAGALDVSPVNVSMGGTITPHGTLGISLGVGSILLGGTITPHAARPIIEVDKIMRGRCTPTVIGRVPGTGGGGGTGDAGSPGPGDGTGTSGDGSTTLVDCPCTIHLTIGGGLVVTVGRAVTTGPRRRNLLGCGVYQVFATTRGGKSILVTIPWTSLSWGRVLGDTSQATIEVNGISGISESCARGLAGLRPRKHEIAIYRSSYLQWAGPISGPLKVVGDKLTIPALDLSSWLDRRRIRHNYDVTGDLADIFAVYVDDAMASDPTPRLLISGGEAGIIGQRSVLAAAHQMAGPLVRELGQSGVPWTVVKRTLLYGLSVTPPDPVALLIDDSYIDQPDVSVLDMGANDVVVAGTSTGQDGDSLYGYSRDAASQAEYGLLDQVFRESLILDPISAQARASSDLDLLHDPPTVINGGTLTPFAPVLIDQLIPGVQIDNRLLTSLFPVAGPFQLTKLDVQAGNDGSEQVAVTFQPVGSAS